MREYALGGSLRRVLYRSALASTLLAIALTPQLAQAFDADSDTITDEADAFPCNSASASVVFSPSQGEHGLLLFEDQWPEKGDLDFNDVALSYNYIFELTAQGQVQSVRATFNALALGGIFNNGLGFHLSVPTSSVASVRQTIGTGASTPLTPISSESELTLSLLPNLRQLFDGQGDTINSDPNKPVQVGQPLEVEIRFSTPVTLDLGQAPFDVYIFRTEGQGHEIHRPQYSGTSAMDRGLFGSKDDGSTPSRHFIDTDGMPFVLNLPGLRPWAREGVSIEHLYPNIVQFAASGGSQAQDFYMSAVDYDYAFGYTPQSNPPAPNEDYVVVAPSFIGPSSIPANTACVNAWGLSVTYGTQRDTFGYDSVSDSNGDLLVTGYTTRSFSGISNMGGQDIFVAKYSRTGSLLWSTQFGGSASETGRAIAVDSARNIYIVGETRSAFDSQTNAGLVDAFVTKLDSNGNRLWTRFLGGSGYDRGLGVTVEPTTGTVYVAGGSSSTNLAGASYSGTTTASFVARFDTNGNRQWVQQFQADPQSTSNYSYIADLTLDRNGDLVMVGSERRYSQNGSASENQFVAKRPSNGGPLAWVNHIGGYGYYENSSDYRFAHALGVASDSTGAVYVTGLWEAGSKVSTWEGWSRTAGDVSSDITLTKVDASGATLWQRSLGSAGSGIDSGLSLSVDATSVYLLGYTSGTMPGQTNRGGYDYLLARYDGSGNQQWLAQHGTTSDDGCFGASIDTASSTVYILGNTGNVLGNPVDYQNTYFGFIARHNLGTGTQTSFQATVDTSAAGPTCKAILAAGGSKGNGIYTIDPDGSGPNVPFNAYCDMTTHGGGWTLVQLGRYNRTANLYTDAAVNAISSPTQSTSAKLSRAVQGQILLAGDRMLRMGNSSYGYLFFGPLEPSWITSGINGYNSSGYGNPILPRMVSATYGQAGTNNCRFSWALNQTPAGCSNTNNGTGECDLGLHWGQWAAGGYGSGGSAQDGAYMNYGLGGAGPLYSAYELWAR